MSWFLLFQFLSDFPDGSKQMMFQGKTFHRNINFHVMNSGAFVVLLFIKLQRKKMKLFQKWKSFLTAYVRSLWSLAMEAFLINRCSETPSNWGGPKEETARMAHNRTPLTESSQEIFEKYQIDEEVGFALPNPLVRRGTEIWTKMFYYHCLPGQVYCYWTDVVQ